MPTRIPERRPQAGLNSWLAAGMSEQEILDDYPELESEDFRAVYEFAARMGRRIAQSLFRPRPATRGG